jgi:hypothetical protein
MSLFSSYGRAGVARRVLEKTRQGEPAMERRAFLFHLHPHMRSHADAIYQAYHPDQPNAEARQEWHRKEKTRQWLGG